jgi:hypothetical protein
MVPSHQQYTPRQGSTHSGSTYAEHTHKWQYTYTHTWVKAVRSLNALCQCTVVVGLAALQQGKEQHSDLTGPCPVADLGHLCGLGHLVGLPVVCE